MATKTTKTKKTTKKYTEEQKRFYKFYKEQLSKNTLDTYLEIIGWVVNKGEGFVITSMSRSRQVKSVIKKAEAAGIELEYKGNTEGKKNKNTVTEIADKVLTDDQFETLMAGVPNTPKGRELVKAARISINTGLRLSEVLSIEPTAITYKTTKQGKEVIKIRVTGKGSKKRDVYLPITQKSLVDGFDKFNISDKYCQMAIKRAAVKNGLKNITFHAFRHTYASNLVNNKNLHLAYVQRLLGHADVKTTQIYVHVSDDELAEALA